MGLNEPTLLSLPADILNDIGSCLGDQDWCRMELSSKQLHNILSRPNPDEWCLDLTARFKFKAFTPEECRLPIGLTSCHCHFDRPVAVLHISHGFADRSCHQTQTICLQMAREKDGEVLPHQIHVF